MQTPKLGVWKTSKGKSSTLSRGFIAIVFHLYMFIFLLGGGGRMGVPKQNQPELGDRQQQLLSFGHGSSLNFTIPKWHVFLAKRNKNPLQYIFMLFKQWHCCCLKPPANYNSGDITSEV